MERIYIGTYSNQIVILNFNKGNLSIVNKIENIDNPSYLHINKDILYAVSETKQGGLSAFKILNNNLKKINSKVINQSLPCFITTNQKDCLLVANYGSGSICMYELKNDGSIGKEIMQKQYSNANMHFAEFIGKHIYAVDLGNDTIYIYNNKMESIANIYTSPKSGPRHLAIDKYGKKIYVVTELSNQILVYEKKENNIELIQNICTLPNESTKSFAGAIKISNDSKYIYVTNRGHNSISVFKQNESRLELIQNISSFGDFPRDMILNKTEEYAIVVNQKSDNIVVFKRDIKDGTLKKIKDADMRVEKPSCIVRRYYGI